MSGRAVPRLGPGTVYLPGLHPLITARPDLFPVLEVEPQTVWLRGPDGLHLDLRRLERIAALADHCVVHGVGFPVGTARPTLVDRAADLFVASVQAVRAPWASEHLAYNRAQVRGAVQEAGFLLPPAQTDAGIEVYAAEIRRIQRLLPVPFAVENGVSYLRPLPGELPDGAWLAAVAEAADCLLLLDLHNAWCNHLNGRQKIDDFLAAIPLDRVVEVHVAGGLWMNGLWLDAHSGAVPDPVMSLAAEVLPHLPNLGALFFELTPTMLGRFGEAAVLDQMEALHRLWERVPAAPPPRPATAALPPQASPGVASPGAIEAVSAWEDRLYDAIRGAPSAEPGLDPQAAGPRTWRALIEEFRQSSVAGALPYTTRHLLQSGRGDWLEARLAEWFEQAPPDQFGGDEALGFAGFLRASLAPGDPINALLDYECALVAWLTGRQEAQVRAPFDLIAALGALASGRAWQPGGEDSLAHVSATGIRFCDAQGRLVAALPW